GLDVARHLERCRELASRGYRPSGLSVAQGRAGEPPVAASVWVRPAVTGEQRDALAQRQANAAVALLHLGQPEPVWPLFRQREHPDAGTHLIHGAGPLGADVRLLLGRLAVETDTSARQGLILALGEYTTGQLPADLVTEWAARLRKWYREDPDPGVHG